jgi:hypothetical protein
VQVIVRRLARAKVRRMCRTFVEPRNTPKEQTMAKRIDTLIQRAAAFALAAVITLAVLVGIDSLARVDVASGGTAIARPVQADTGTGRGAARLGPPR